MATRQRRQKDVFGLQIAMDDLLMMCFNQCLCDLADNLLRTLQVHGACRQSVGQALAEKKLHHNVRDAVFVHVVVGNVGDMGVI